MFKNPSAKGAGKNPPLSRAEKRAVEKHLRRVRRQLYKNLFKSYRGWWYWHCLMKKYKNPDIKNSAVVLLPDNNGRDNYLALLYLDRMLTQHKFTKALILTQSGLVKKSAGLFSKKVAAVVDCPRKKAEELMQFYCLYNFDKRFFCGSLDEPYGRNGSRMIGAKGISAEEIFAIGVYRIYPYIKANAPAYTGGDAEIAEFFRDGAEAASEGYGEYTEDAER